MIDLQLIPLGERAWRSIIDHVTSVGDEAENYSLEAKSDIDLGTKLGVAKVAKFLLGSANRLPAKALRQFGGYSVLVIGASKGESSGVPRGTEFHELEDKLRPYLGAHFPSFDYGRIALDNDREVLLIICDPPVAGQPIFPCHRDFQPEERSNRRDALVDGAIYVRGASNTRPAKAGEVLALVERALGGGKPPVDLTVSTVGSVGRMVQLDELITYLYNQAEARATETLSRKRQPPPDVRKHSSSFSDLMPTPFSQSALFRSEPNASEYSKLLDDWCKQREDHINAGRAHLIGIALDGVGIEVVSNNRFVAKPRLVVTFHGCEAVRYLEREDADWRRLCAPIVPRDWNSSGISTAGFDLAGLGIRPRNDPVSWSNSGNDALVVLTPEAFRPSTLWTSGSSDYVLLSRNNDTTTVTVTWELTEEGSDTVSSGEFTLGTTEIHDTLRLYQEIFVDPLTEN